MIRTVTATRYVTPLREGGSLPAIIEGDDGALYVVKFRGAGQGPKALIAELLAGTIGQQLGLPVPELVLVELDADLGRNEGDPEIQALIRASVGLNLALAYLPGALTFDPLATPQLDPLLASAIVWFDGYVTNVDRTARNTNMLWWQGGLWLIDHGASLYFHHTWADYQARSRSPFAPIKDHVLLRQASALEQIDADLVPRITPALIDALVAQLPQDWLEHGGGPGDPAARRDAYTGYLLRRLEAPRPFVEEAQRARTQSV